jgi:hypothetical protein
MKEAEGLTIKQIKKIFYCELSHSSFSTCDNSSPVALSGTVTKKSTDCCFLKSNPSLYRLCKASPSASLKSS